MWLCSLIFWISTAGAALLVAHTASRFARRPGVLPPNGQRDALGFFTDPEAAVRVPLGAAAPVTIGAADIVAYAPDLLLSAARSNLAEAAQRYEAVVAEQKELAHRAVNTLRLQLSPLGTEAGSDLAADSIPKKHVAAAALARAAVQALSSPAAEVAAPEPTLGNTTDGGAPAAAPAGFDHALAQRAAMLCLSTYHSADDPAAAAARVEEDMRREAEVEVAKGQAGSQLRLVAEVRSDATDTYALLARNDTCLFVAFRGSCKAKNVITDIDYDNDAATTRAFAQECDLPISEMILHRGFVEAYRSLRPQLHAAIEAEVATEGLPGEGAGLGLVLTGHSMGGAMAMLAALDLAHHKPHLRPVCTYTFGAPRVGDATFARLFSRTFPHAAHHWALQAASDAVPHLPFRVWGFEHPDGVAVLTDDSDGAQACLRRSGDPGDSVACMRPKEGRAVNWATCHDLHWYMERLRSALGESAFVAA